MPNKKLDEYGDYDIIPADKVIAEWIKNPKFVREYEALEEKYAKIHRQIRAKDARLARRAALMARIRETAQGCWHWLMGGHKPATS